MLTRQRLTVTPLFKENNWTGHDVILYLSLLPIELRARIILTQLSFINHIRPKKFKNHVIQHSVYIRLLRRSIRHHHRDINLFRKQLALNLLSDREKETLNVIRTTRQDGDILVPVFIIDTPAQAPTSKAVHFEPNHGSRSATSNKSSSWRTTDGEESSP